MKYTSAMAQLLLSRDHGKQGVRPTPDASRSDEQPAETKAAPVIPADVPAPSQKQAPETVDATRQASQRQQAPSDETSRPNLYEAASQTPLFQGAGGSVINFLRVLLAKWRLVMLTAVFGVVAGVLYHRSQDTFYSATSTIRMTVRKPRIMKQEEAVIDQSTYWGADEILNTRLHILRSEAIRDRVAKELPERYPDLKASSPEIRAVVSGASLKQIKGTHLIHVACVTGNKSLPVPVVNTYARVAGASIKDDIDQTSEAAVQWLRDQSEAQRAKLHKAEDMLMVFRQKYKIDEVENEKQTVEQLLVGLGQSLVQADTEAMLAKSMVDALAKSQIDPNNAGELPSSVPNIGDIQTRMGVLTDAVQKRALMLARYTEEHPKVKDADRLINSLHQQFNEAIDRAKKTAQANLSLIEQQVQTLRARKTEMENRLVEVQKQIVSFNIELEGLNRKLKTDEITYDELLRRIEEARLATEENTALVTLVQEAREPPAAVRPNAHRALLMGGLLGLALGFCLAYVSYQFEDFISDVSTVKHEFGVPLVGVVPHVSGNPKTRDLALSCASDRFSSVAEAFAGIRTTLNALLHVAGSDGSAIVVTGATPREGKTLTSCNLAITLSRNGQRTLLIDADMRRPELHKVFGIPENAPSLLGELVKGATGNFQGLAQKTDIPNLWVVSGNGRIDDVNPAQVLGGDLVKKFVRWAKGEYDFVVIDTPPIGIFSDGLILGTVVDGVLMVCRCDRSRKTAVRQGLEDLAKSGSKVVGVIVCDLPSSRLAARLGYGRYQYGYGYDHYRYYKQHPSLRKQTA